ASTTDVIDAGTITPSAAVIKNGDTVVTAKYGITYETGKLVIKQAAPVLTTTPAAETLIYSGMAQALVKEGNTADGKLWYAIGDKESVAAFDGNTDSVEKKWSQSIPTATNADTYYVWYMVVGDANHSNTEPDKVEVTVAKATPTVTAPTAKTLTYTGEAQELVTAGSTNGGELQYSLDGTNYSTTIPKGTEAGNYTVYFKVVGDDNYADTPAASSFTVTIAGADTGNTKPGAADKLTYTGEAQKLVTGGSVTGGELRYVLGTDASTAPALDSFKTDIPTGTDAGTYYVWYRVEGDANHNDVAPACIEVKIAKAAIKPEVSITGWTYGEKANAPAVTGNTDNGAVTYTYSDKADGTFTATVPANAGTWYVKASVAEIDNYLGGEATLSFAIAKKNLTVVADNKTKVEGDADPQLTYTVTGLVGSDTLTGALARQPGEDAGTYDITQGTLAASDNYNISFTKGTLTITAKPVSGHVEVETKTGAGVPPMKVEGLTDELAKKVLTPVELVMMDGGANAHVYVEATNTDGSLSDEIRQRIASALPAGATVAASMDVSMYKQVGDNLPVKVSGLPAPVTLEFDVSKYGTASADKKRTIFVAHFVKGAWRVEGQSAGPTVTVQVDSLSPLAIAYVDTHIATPEPTMKPTAKPKPTSKPTVKPTATPKPTSKPTVKPTVTPKPTKQPVESDITLLATMKASGKTDMKLSWTRVKDADGYDIFFRRCGTGDYPLIASVKSSASRSYKVTGLKKATGYKAYVKAWKKVRGVKTYIGKASPTVHAITGGYTKKAANPKTVTVRASKVTLTIGKSSTIRATVKGVKSGRQVLAHTKLLRYYSSNRNVATVSSTGKIRATGAGSCKIYVVANNGVRTTVKVTVIDGPTKIA
ncbi:MAG: fibronectin type III domain-containing protein, partial [Loktanella sp.]|nr:fibronectin type III domain-containing protein [Loktanella sp.]